VAGPGSAPRSRGSREAGWPDPAPGGPERDGPEPGPGGTRPGGTRPGGARPGGTRPGGTRPGGAPPSGAPPSGAPPGGAGPPTGPAAARAGHPPAGAGRTAAGRAGRRPAGAAGRAEQKGVAAPRGAPGPREPPALLTLTWLLPMLLPRTRSGAPPIVGGTDTPGNRRRGQVVDAAGEGDLTVRQPPGPGRSGGHLRGAMGGVPRPRRGRSESFSAGGDLDPLPRRPARHAPSGCSAERVRGRGRGRAADRWSVVTRGLSGRPPRSTSGGHGVPRNAPRGPGAGRTPSRLRSSTSRSGRARCSAEHRRSPGTGHTRSGEPVADRRRPARRSAEHRPMSLLPDRWWASGEPRTG
jgi:hypothetical protein